MSSWPLRRCILLNAALVLAACSSSLDEDLMARACSEDGRCLPGYVCSAERLCVREGSQELGSGMEPRAGSGSAGRGAVVGRGGSDQEPSDAAVGDGQASDASVVLDADPPDPGDPPAAGGGGVSGSSAGTAGIVTAGTSAPPTSGTGSIGSGGAGSTAPPPSGSGGSGASGGAGMSGAGTGGSGTGAAGMSGAGGAGTGGAGGAGTGGAGRAGSSGSGGASGTGAPACNNANRTRCGDQCVNLQNNPMHCGACGASCSEPRRCQEGVCRANGNGQSGGLNVAELEKLVMRFGLSLDDVLEELDVERDELEGVELSLADLERAGITLQQLMAAGITRADLERIGIDVG